MLANSPRGLYLWKENTRSRYDTEVFFGQETLPILATRLNYPIAFLAARCATFAQQNTYATTGSYGHSRTPKTNSRSGFQARNPNGLARGCLGYTDMKTVRLRAATARLIASRSGPMRSLADDTVAMVRMRSVILAAVFPLLISHRFKTS